MVTREGRSVLSYDVEELYDKYEECWLEPTVPAMLAWIHPEESPEDRWALRFDLALVRSQRARERMRCRAGDGGRRRDRRCHGTCRAQGGRTRRGGATGHGLAEQAGPDRDLGIQRMRAGLR